jgi:hypothetical protein
MIREMETPGAEPVTVTVELPADFEEAERMAERAMATVMLLLDDGTPVLLATTEITGEVVSPVIDRMDAGRRLARATSGAGQGHGYTGISVVKCEP